MRSAPAASAKQVAIKNAEPVSLTLNSGNLRIDSAHLTGPQTDIQAKGSLSLKDRSMNLSLDANANLGVLQTLDRDFSSSGNVTVAATVRGAFAKPAVNGTAQLKNASVNYTQFPNGISNANGTVEFSGATASLRNLTAETGGGKLTLSGFLLLSDSPRFGLRASASNVRIDVQQGVSIVTNANLNLTGTKAASTLSGNAVIARVNYAIQNRLGLDPRPRGSAGCGKRRAIHAGQYETGCTGNHLRRSGGAIGLGAGPGRQCEPARAGHGLASVRAGPGHSDLGNACRDCVRFLLEADVWVRQTTEAANPGRGGCQDHLLPRL